MNQKSPRLSPRTRCVEGTRPSPCKSGQFGWTAAIERVLKTWANGFPASCLPRTVTVPALVCIAGEVSPAPAVQVEIQYFTAAKHELYGRAAAVKPLRALTAAVPPVRALLKRQREAVVRSKLPTKHTNHMKTEVHFTDEPVKVPSSPVLSLGDLYSTPGARKALEESGQSYVPFLRAISAAIGEIAARKIGRAMMRRSKVTAGVLAVYHTAKGEKLWIITEWDRSVTTILLPDEY